MFWVQRLKSEEHDAAWAISYGDMMSLLLAVFVMIAAMGEMKAGARFASVRDAMRGAFGFAVAPAPALDRRSRMPTLPEQLRQAGLLGATGPWVRPDQDDALKCCEATHEGDRLIIRVTGSVAFDPFSAVLKPAAQSAIERLAVLLQRGKARIEVRGHNGDGRLPKDSTYRDGLDLAYARARCVVELLTHAGVGPERVFVSACDDQDPLIAPGPDGMSAAGNHRIEIVVHAAQGIEGNYQFAEKGQSNAH